jgi:hypothetical protein
MQYPEHTIESYKAAALMGAGIIECDVTFTKDLELICTCLSSVFRDGFHYSDQIELTVTLSI